MINILLITNKTDITTDFIVKKLVASNANFYRLNTEDIGNSIQISFDFSTHQFFIVDLLSNIQIDLLKIRSVYFRRPEIIINDTDLSEGESNFKKSELLFSLEGLYRILSDAFWLNNVYDIRNAENKIYQLLLAKQIGFDVPETVITNHPPLAYNFYQKQSESIIIKPIKSGLIEGVKEEGVVFTTKINLKEIDKARIQSCPVYLQKLIEKKGDIRVTIVGDELFAAFIDSQKQLVSRVDWRKSPLPLPHSAIALPPKIAEKCFDLMIKLQLNFGAIDFVLDTSGKYIFLEINPNGQWAWIERQLDYKISDKITSILIGKAFN